MKYKRLSLEELKALEPEFISFLATNQITADDWVKLKEETPEKVDSLIDIFSDLVYEKVLKRVMYLEYRSEKEMSIFFCDENVLKMIGLKVNPISNVNLNSENILEQWNNSNSGVKIFSNEKSYTREREIEIFELLQTGCFITDEKLYKKLSELVVR